MFWMTLTGYQVLVVGTKKQWPRKRLRTASSTLLNPVWPDATPLPLELPESRLCRPLLIGTVTVEFVNVPLTFNAMVTFNWVGKRFTPHWTEMSRSSKSSGFVPRIFENSGSTALGRRAGAGPPALGIGLIVGRSTVTFGEGKS